MTSRKQLNRNIKEEVKVKLESNLEQNENSNPENQSAFLTQYFNSRKKQKPDAVAIQFSMKKDLEKMIKEKRIFIYSNTKQRIGQQKESKRSIELSFRIKLIQWNNDINRDLQNSRQVSQDLSEIQQQFWFNKLNNIIQQNWKYIFSFEDWKNIQKLLQDVQTIFRSVYSIQSEEYLLESGILSTTTSKDVLIEQFEKMNEYIVEWLDRKVYYENISFEYTDLNALQDQMMDDLEYMFCNKKVAIPVIFNFQIQIKKEGKDAMRLIFVKFFNDLHLQKSIQINMQQLDKYEIQKFWNIQIDWIQNNLCKYYTEHQNKIIKNKIDKVNEVIKDQQID